MNEKYMKRKEGFEVSHKNVPSSTPKFGVNFGLGLGKNWVLSQKWVWVINGSDLGFGSDLGLESKLSFGLKLDSGPEMGQNRVFT